MMRALVIAALLGTLACKKTPAAPAASTRGAVTQTAQTQAEAVSEILANFERVHFAVDSSSLTADAQQALSANATLLQEFPALRVEVQGHADERGTIDYNLALGQRRALTVVGYLERQGVSGGRLSVVSYGEERPLEQGRSEVAWAANRRAEFRVLEGRNVAQGTVD